MKLIGLLVLLGLIPSMQGEVINNPNNPPFGPCVGSFLNNQPILPTGMVSPRYQQICQNHKNQPRYATLYDTQNRIPVYSAYHYKGHSSGLVRKGNWFVEPQLDDQNKGPVMDTEAKAGAKVGVSQAVEDDYTRRNNPNCYERGHLYPHCENCDKDQAHSTFTLTNSAPQSPDDNKQWYHKVEKQLIESIDNECKQNTQTNAHEAYVVTGVIPSGNNGIAPTLLNNRVNVPSHYWTAFCCESKNNPAGANPPPLISGGYVMRMDDFGTGSVDYYRAVVPPTHPNQAVADLNKDLAKYYGLTGANSFQVFGNIKGCI